MGDWEHGNNLEIMSIATEDGYGRPGVRLREFINSGFRELIVTDFVEGLVTEKTVREAMMQYANEDHSESLDAGKYSRRNSRVLHIDMKDTVSTWISTIRTAFPKCTKRKILAEDMKDNRYWRAGMGEEIVNAILLSRGA